MKYNTKGDWVINGSNYKRNDWVVCKSLWSQVEWSTDIDFLGSRKPINKPYVNLYKEIMKLNNKICQ